MRYPAVSLLALMVALSACHSAGTSGAGSHFFSEYPQSGIGSQLTAGRPEAASIPASSAAGLMTRGFYQSSSDTTGAIPPRSDVVQLDGSKVALNYVNIDLQTFVKSFFVTVLKQNVIVDPSLGGKVTVRTADDLDKNTALAIVKSALLANGATLEVHDGTYQVRALSSSRSNPEMETRVIPLEYIDPDQARAAIQPLLGSGVRVAGNQNGRFLVLIGGESDLDNLQQLVATLDVDHLRGRSIGLFPLKDSKADVVASELQKMFGSADSKGPQIIPVERVNGLLVIATHSEDLARAKRWLAALDQGERSAGRVFIYPVQNRRAAELANILNSMFGGRNATNAASERTVAPGLTPAASTFGPVGGGGGAVGGGDQALPGPTSHAAEGGDMVAGSPNGMDSGDSGNGQHVQIRADTSTNSIVVVGSPEQYPRIAEAIRALDVEPAQVLIEATIAEVDLNNNLSHGVQWYFQHGPLSTGLSNGSPISSSAQGAGFTYTFQAANAGLIINALENLTKVQIVSAPALTVLNNQTATLKVGDEVPITTQSAQSVLTAGAPIVSTIQMVDTGLIMSVTPRVNSSGLVMLDISQEDSEVVPTTSSTINSPTIRQRSVNSSVAVNSGTEIVLGGLISNSRQKGKEGFPILQDIPVLGEAFTDNNSTQEQRTELLIIIKPTILANHDDVKAVTDEIEHKMSSLDPTFR